MVFKYVFLVIVCASTSAAKVPDGVNFGGWLNLEDWFLSGAVGSHVSTTAEHGQGKCLPPGLLQLSEQWPSEGYLTKHMNDTWGPDETARLFMAYRRNFIGNQDLQDVQSLGIKKVRLPLNWAAFADALGPIDSITYGSHNPDDEAAVVPDPFYSTTRAFVTVPRSWLKKFLRRCANHGIGVLLDMHAFPGGSSQGTYNGVWPSEPRFWTNTSMMGNKTMQLTEVGHMIVKRMVEWVEELDGVERSAVAGLTLMNEPGHLSRGTSWANETQILNWLEGAADVFRKSNLWWTPGWRGEPMKLYMNIIETAFDNFYDTVPAWWDKTFTKWEQKVWAVIDMHWYTAWSGDECSGRTVDGGAYFCDDPLDDIRDVILKCVGDHVQKMTEHFGGLKSCSEFSIGTYDQAQFACIDKETQDIFFEEQLHGFNRSNIESFFWTWKMPYGPIFEPGWSLKHHLGKENTLRSLACLEPRASSESSANLGVSL